MSHRVKARRDFLAAVDGLEDALHGQGIPAVVRRGRDGLAGKDGRHVELDGDPAPARWRCRQVAAWPGAGSGDGGVMRGAGGGAGGARLAVPLAEAPRQERRSRLHPLGRAGTTERLLPGNLGRRRCHGGRLARSLAGGRRLLLDRAGHRRGVSREAPRTGLHCPTRRGPRGTADPPSKCSRRAARGAGAVTGSATGGSGGRELGIHDRGELRTGRGDGGGSAAGSGARRRGQLDRRRGGRVSLQHRRPASSAPPARVGFGLADVRARHGARPPHRGHRSLR